MLESTQPGALTISIPDQSYEPLPTSSKTRLLVTTAKGIYSWNNCGAIELFSSTSQGIVSARKLQTGKDVLAVADSQVIVLHEVEGDVQRTYRLKNEDQDKVRKLFYHQGKERLFFTTALQNAIQTFSLQTGQLLDAGPMHQSPPTTFAVSPACDMLLSASVDPRIIYLSRIEYKQPPLLFIPNCSNATVAAMAFHPTRPSIFALAFQDGTIAAYNATVIPSDEFAEERYSYARIYGEIAHLKHVHNVEDETSESTTKSHLDQRSTITSIQFLADQPCSVVSVGTDGHCCITQFEKDGDKSCKIIQQWQLTAPATSLAILKPKHQITVTQMDGVGDDVHLAHTSPVLLAIGASNGTVSIYNRTGKLLATRAFETHGQILDLEWTENIGETPTASRKAPTRSPSRSISVPELGAQRDMPLRNSRSSIGSKILVKLHTKEHPPDDYLLQTKHAIDDIEEELHGSLATAIKSNPTETANHPTRSQSQAGSSPPGSDAQSDELTDVATIEPQENIQPREFLKPTSPTRMEILQDSRNVSDHRSFHSSSRRIRIPVIPARPVPRPGGNLALRRMESAKARYSSVVLPSPVPNEVVTAVTTGQQPFRAINHGGGLRPRVFRHRSSRVSPFTEVSVTAVGPVVSSHSFQSLPSTPLISPRSQPAPVQYDRLQRNNSGAESSTGTSHVSFLADLRKASAIPVKSNLNNPEVVRLGSVRQGRPLQIDTSPIMTPHSSDSGTSLQSVLVWTPCTDRRINAISPNVMSKPSFLLPKLDLQTKANEGRNSGTTKSRGPVSDTSSVSQLDWNIGRRQLQQASSDDTKVKKPIREERIGNTLNNGTLEQKTNSGGQLDVQYLQQPKTPLLRRQETVINLKSRRAESVPAPVSDASADRATAKAVPVDAQPRLSDTALPAKDWEGADIPGESKDQNKISSVSFSNPREYDPAPRQSSHSKSMFDLRQSRHGSTIGSQSTYTIEDVIRVECAALATRIDVAFVEQKGWLEGFLRDQNWYVQRLEEENRKFRAELARLRKVRD